MLKNVKKRNQVMAFLLSFILCTSTFGSALTMAASGKKYDKPLNSMKYKLEQLAISKLSKKGGIQKNKEKESDPNKEVRVIVTLKAPSAYQINKNASLSKAKIEKKEVIDEQQVVKNRVVKITGSKVTNSFGYLVNGFSTNVKRSQVDEIKKIPGVKDAKEANVYNVNMSYATEITQAKQVWQDIGYKGEGTVISVIDSGIDVKHKDMKLTDVKKAKITDLYSSYATYKVPFVYNYADKNYDVYDRNANTGAHGMHVAGIIAGNGDETQIKDNKSIRGVAPEAQLFAMKVFSNEPGTSGAFADDIVAAIEDSVVLGADVINMSLGSPAGFVDADDAEQIVVKNATEKGVTVVVAAGNESMSTTGKLPGVPDTATVGNPGISKEAIQVASYENSKRAGIGFDYESSEGKSTEGMIYTTSEVKPEDVLKDAAGYEIVDLGAIDNDEYSSEIYSKAKGKIALIQKVDKDGSSYAGKKKHAQGEGAKGVIFYRPDTKYISTLPDGDVTIPCIHIGRDDGLKLKSLIDKDLRVFFNANLTVSKNQNAETMSDFSSWGPSPDLDFKPEITAPGGQIWSTVNDNKYELMSGTSMATPHVAGAEALLIGAKKAAGVKLSRKQFVDFVKNISMNTSKIVMDKEHSVPYSPRKQGAGMIQIKDAINNDVTVTYNGKASVALKEIEKVSTFEVKLHNYGSTAVSYKLENGGILTECKAEVKGDAIETPYDITIDGATMIFNNNNVTVNPGEDKTISVTITIPDGFQTEQFVEGYVKLTSTTEKEPSLSIPYVGFYGNWSKPLIMDKPIWDEEHLYNGSMLLYPYPLMDLVLGETIDKNGDMKVNPDAIAISNNPNTLIDVVCPSIGMLRNAKKIVTEVVDESGKVVRVLGEEKTFRKSVAAYDGGRPSKLLSGSWDGKVYNQSTGKYEPVKDGQYYIRVRSTINYENAQEQVIKMPIKIDSAEPNVEIISPEAVNTALGYVLRWKASDILSGLHFENGSGEKMDGWPDIRINGDNIWYPKVNMEDNGTFNMTLSDLKEGENKIELTVYDNAGNSQTVEKNITVNSGAIPEPKADVKVSLYDGSVYPDVVDGKYKVKGTVSDKVKEITVNNVVADIDVNTGNFIANIPVIDEAENKITVIAKNAEGQEIYNKIYKCSFDSKPPVIEITNINNEVILPTMAEGFAGKVVTTATSISVEGSVKDKHINSVEINEQYVPVNKEDGTFKATIPVEGPTILTLKALDEAYNKSEKKYIIVAENKDAELKYNFLNLYTGAMPKPEEIVKRNGVYYFNVVGILNKNVKQVRIQNKVVPVQDLVISTYVPIEEGMTKISVYIEDFDGTVAADYASGVYFDVTAPVINMTSPYTSNSEYNPVVCDKDGTVTIKGNVADNTFGYKFYINGNIIAESTNLSPVGIDGTLKKFDVKLPAKVGDIIELKAVDLFGNEVVKHINIVNENNMILITNKTGVSEFKLGSDAKVNISARNVSNKNMKASLIVALFDKDNRFITYTCSSQEIKAGATVELAGMLKMPVSGDGYKIKAFVWDSLENGNPLSYAIEIPVVLK